MSLAEQLQEAKLKKPSGPIKDFSSPKTAGFLSEAEVKSYQCCVLDVNTETWMHLLEDCTFPTKYCPITLEEAQFFIHTYTRLFAKLDPSDIYQVDWRSTLSDEERVTVDAMTARLATVMAAFTRDGYVFVKTSSRSAKDAPLYQDQLEKLFREQMERVDPGQASDENIQITCLLQASFRAMKMRNAADVIDMFVCSERIFQDMLLAVEMKHRFQENFVVRKFYDIDVDMEFRGFVFGQKLTALSQYNYSIFSARLVREKDAILSSIQTFFEGSVRPRLENTEFTENYIIDFALCAEENAEGKVWVIEINPFMCTTDAALFSWEHERPLLEGEGNFEFRLTQKRKPGVITMLPQKARAMLKGFNATIAKSPKT